MTRKPFCGIANRHLELSAKKKLEDKVCLHDMCIVYTVVGKKAHLRTKQYQAVKKSSL